MRYSIPPKAPLVMLLFLFLLASCEDPIDVTTQWRTNNESLFKEYVSKEDYKKASTPGSPTHICTKWLAHGEGKEHPIETSRIRCHYEMRVLVGNKVMDGNYGSERSAEFTINRGPKKQLVEGVRIGLQQMVVGDEAGTIIPWYLAYGERRTEEISPYSALKFRVKFEEIILETQRTAGAHE